MRRSLPGLQESGQIHCELRTSTVLISKAQGQRGPVRTHLDSALPTGRCLLHTEQQITIRLKEHRASAKTDHTLGHKANLKD